MIKYCDYCLKEVNCEYKESNKIDIINGTEINYLEKYYVCSKCGNEFYDDLYNYNVKTVNNKLREKSGLITNNEIEEIMKKYSIGKKPLSIVLGLGEITITRYLSGQNPTKDNSFLLKNILNNPFLYEMYLMANKDKISSVAYKKSMGKAKQEELSHNNSKLYNIALYILEREKEVDALSLQKLLFFSCGFSKIFTSIELNCDDCEAWIYGPVYRDIYEAFSYYGYNKINYDELVKSREVALSCEEKKYIDSIIDAFGFFSGSILREMTHMTSPWINARKGLKEDSFSNRIIESDSIEKYFKKISIDYDIKTYEDIRKYSLDMYIKAKNNLMK